jgi:hypothetical protein
VLFSKVIDQIRQTGCVGIKGNRISRSASDGSLGDGADTLEGLGGFDALADQCEACEELGDALGKPTSNRLGLVGGAISFSLPTVPFLDGEQGIV